MPSIAKPPFIAVRCREQNAFLVRPRNAIVRPLTRGASHRGSGRGPLVMAPKDLPHPEPAHERRVEARTAAVAAAGLVVLLVAGVAGIWLWLRARGVDLAGMSTSDVEAMVRGWAPWAWLGSIA